MENSTENSQQCVQHEGDVGDGEEVDLSQYFKAGDENGLTEPWSVRRRVKALKNLMISGLKLEARFYDEVSALERKYEGEFQPFYKKRLEIISGTYEPKDDECSFPEESDTAYELLRKARQVHIPMMSSRTNENRGSEGDESVEGIPQFWLTAMKNVGVLSEMIESHDEPVLHYLDDVTVELVNDPKGFKLHFFFAPNEFFPHPVLTKTYVMKNEIDELDPLSYDGPEITNCQGFTINWNEGKNVTQILRQKKTKDKTGSTKIITEKFKVPSFFDFFSPPQIPADPNFEMDEDILVQLTRDFDVGQFIRETFIPRAVMHYTGEAEGTERGSDDEGDDESDYEGVSDDLANLSVGKPRADDPYDE